MFNERILDMKWSEIDIKEKAAIVTAIAAFVVGWGLTIAGFIVPPVGEIADGVLWVLGQSLIYAASVFGITSYFSSETRRMKKDISEFVQRSIEKQSENESEIE
jgi:hypothetical protein